MKYYLVELYVIIFTTCLEYELTKLYCFISNSNSVDERAEKLRKGALEV